MDNPSGTTAALDDWLAAHDEEVVALALELLSVDSQNPPGDTRAIVQFIETYLQDLNIEPERVAAKEAKPNIEFAIPGNTETTLLYNGHLDTVPFDVDEWEHDPYGERADDRVYGRGATDMKGAIAAMLHAARAYVETETTPPVTLRFAFVSDEETAGSAGLPALLERDRLNADGCVIGEPTCESGMHSVTVADKGSIWLTLEATGEAAHGSRPPLGENAIDLLFTAVEALQSYLETVTFDVDEDIEQIVEESVSFYEPRMGEATATELFTTPTMNIGTFEGGGTINQVPDAATAEVDIRLTAGVDTAEMLAEIRALLADHAAVNIADVSWSVGTYEPFDSPLAKSTSHVAETVSGEAVCRRSATGGGDVKQLRNAGVPTVEFAFGTNTAHAVDEYIPVAALQDNASVYARLPFEFAAVSNEETENRSKDTASEPP